jgi:hypothetical protein
MIYEKQCNAVATLIHELKRSETQANHLITSDLYSPQLNQVVSHTQALMKVQLYIFNTYLSRI